MNMERQKLFIKSMARFLRNIFRISPPYGNTSSDTYCEPIQKLYEEKKLKLSQVEIEWIYQSPGILNLNQRKFKKSLNRGRRLLNIIYLPLDKLDFYLYTSGSPLTFEGIKIITVGYYSQNWTNPQVTKVMETAKREFLEVILKAREEEGLPVPEELKNSP